MSLNFNQRLHFLKTQNDKYLKISFLCFSLSLIFATIFVPQKIQAQTTIARQDFESVPATPTMTYSVSGTGGTAVVSSGQSGSSSTNSPALTNLFSEGAQGYRTANTSRTITFSAVNTTNFTDVNFTIRLASFSIGSSGNGADGGDAATVQVSPDNGSTWYTRVVVNGNSNARWSFSGGTGNASNTYAANNTSSNYAPSSGGIRTTDGFSTITINSLPSVSQLIVRIVLLNNDANESWIIDDARISGELVPTCTSPSTQASSLSFATSSPSGLNASWTQGDGDGTMLVVRPTAQSILAPSNGTTYTPDLDYTMAGQINANNKVVFRSNGSSAAITGLSPETQYTATAYEYNNTDNCYNLTSPPSATMRTLSLEPQAHSSAFSAVALSPTSVQLNFDAANTITNADGYIVLQKQGSSAPTGIPADAAGYAINDVIDDATVAALVTNASSTSTVVTGLTAATQYYFTLIPYNWDNANAGTYNYYTAGTIPEATATTTALSIPSISDPTATAIVNTTATLGGNVTSDGGASISARGVVWAINSLNSNPTLGGADCTTVTGSGTTGIFTVAVNSLPPNTLISYVAYATNSQGTSYTTPTTFTTLDVASKLVYGTSPPASGNVGSNLTTFTVRAERPDNSLDTEFLGNITIVKVSGSGNIIGTTTVAAMGGIASFSSVQMDDVGDYTIKATSNGLSDSPTSDVISITVAINSWVSTGGATAWCTAANWSMGTVPSSSQVAQFNNSGSATTAGITFSNCVPEILGIEVSAARTRALTIGSSSSTSGTLVLYGALINSIPNVILRNESDHLFTIQPNISSSGPLALGLGNSSDNIINIDGNGGITISAIISGGNPLTKDGSGSGVLTLSGANTYTGTTTITSGTLRLGGSERISNSSNVILSGGTFSTGATTGFSETVGTLNLSANSTIALGTGNHSLTFAASDGVTWNGTTLTVTGWTGTAGASGTGGKIFVGNSTSGLTSGQLAKISFDGYSGTATILSTGEVVPEGAGPTASVISNGTGNSTICSGGTANIKVTITGGASPYTVVYSDGTNNFTVNNYISGADITVSPVSTTTYTLVSVTDNNSLPGANNSGSAVVTTTSTAVPASVGTYSATVNHTDGATLNYIDGSCNLLARIEDAAGGNVLGITTTMSVLSATNFTGNNGQVYVPRSITLTPNSDGDGTITLFFSQSDFASYNAANGSLLDFPTSGSNADGNIPNIKVARVTNGTLITGTITNVSSPTVNWNTSFSRWEVTVSTNVQGTYYLYSDPICNLSVSNFATVSTNSHSAILNWTPTVGATSYDIRWRVQGSQTWIQSYGWTTTTSTMNGLEPLTTYEAQIKARCTLTTSGLFGNTITYTTTEAPPPPPPINCPTPTNFVVTGTTSTSATFSWGSVPEATAYRLSYRLANTNDAWSNIMRTTTSGDIGGLTPNTAYEARISSYCGGQLVFSPMPTVIQFNTSNPPSINCPTPTNFVVTGTTPTSATFSWGSVPEATAYRLSYRLANTNDAWSNIMRTTTSGDIGGLTPNTAYEARISSYCGGQLVFSPMPTVIPFTTASPFTSDPTTFSGRSSGIGEISSVKIYPNPTAEVLYVSFEAPQAVGAKIRVTDVTGRVVREMYYTGTEGYNQTEINLGDLVQGLYMLQVSSVDGWLYTGRVVKTE